MQFDPLTYKVIGCAMKVHQVLGNGFQEAIYQKCLEIELNKAGIVNQREIYQDIYYDGQIVGTRRADFIIEGRMVVELKATIELLPVHLAQAKNYVVAYDFPIGLLINFGAMKLEHKLIFNPKYKI